MQRTCLTDPFYNHQPPFTFVEDLKQPLHTRAPKDYGVRPKKQEELDLRGLYIRQFFNPDPHDLLQTSYEDFALFLKVYGISATNRAFPLDLVFSATPCFEAYRLQITPQGAILSAADTEGIRRGLIYLEDMLRRSEAPYLQPCDVSRKPHIRSRITRCFFSPINRPPKNGDELSDDIDYYPEAYLNRLMHDGANGIWIYSRFSDLLPSTVIKEYGRGHEKRIQKLNRVIAKCRRYGIGVYLFAIEPAAIPDEIVANYTDMVGGPSGRGNHYFCCGSERGKAYCHEAGKTLLQLAPNLKGFISITYGEGITSCSSAIMQKSDYAHPHRTTPCPRCGKLSHGAVLAQALEALRSGAREVNPQFETISWSYTHRLWEQSDIDDYVDCAPNDVILMQNFEDIGVAEQLGESRLATDYWLSYTGPSDMFLNTARRAIAGGKQIYAKMQVCCSHEVATVPYVPVPGILFDKYRAAHQNGVSGVMQCWFFGNYPSMMSKAAGELAFVNNFDNKTAFLEDLAAIYFGQSKAATIANAWEWFASGYKQYPINILFSYLGPMHDGVAWQLQLLPKNFAPARTWQLQDPTDGDRICEALTGGHTLEEALLLCQQMRDDWQKGLAVMGAITPAHPEQQEQYTIATALGILFASGANILEFYKLRDDLGLGLGNPTQILGKMRQLVEREIQNGQAMIPLCQACGSLGYHSEAEGYKFFPAKILHRNRQLQNLLATEFLAVEQRIAAGLPPLAYYMGEEDYPHVKHYTLTADPLETAPWEPIGESGLHKFRMSAKGTTLFIELQSANADTVFKLCPEFRLTRPCPVVYLTQSGQPYFSFIEYTFNQMFDHRAKAELQKYRNLQVLSGGTHLRLTLDLTEFGVDTLRPMRLSIHANQEKWCPTHRQPTADTIPPRVFCKPEVIAEEYGWILPPKNV